MPPRLLQVDVMTISNLGSLSHLLLKFKTGLSIIIHGRVPPDGRAWIRG